MSAMMPPGGMTSGVLELVRTVCGWWMMSPWSITFAAPIVIKSLSFS